MRQFLRFLLLPLNTMIPISSFSSYDANKSRLKQNLGEMLTHIALPRKHNLLSFEVFTLCPLQLASLRYHAFNFRAPLFYYKCAVFPCIRGIFLLPSIYAYSHCANSPPLIFSLDARKLKGREFSWE